MFWERIRIYLGMYKGTKYKGSTNKIDAVTFEYTLSFWAGRIIIVNFVLYGCLS